MTPKGGNSGTVSPGRGDPAMEFWWNLVRAIVCGRDREGNIMLGNNKGLAVYNVRTRKVKTVDSVVTSRKEVVVSRHVFKESLVQQPGFVAAAQSSIDLSLVHI
ncbi:unnamed protein product [Urochloa humidicola]